MEKLNVGQVVFVFLREDSKIVPVQIFEEVVHRKISGEETSYFARASTDANAKKFRLDIKTQKFFTSIEQARDFMLENATKAIDEICKEAREFSAQFSPKEENSYAGQTIENKSEKFKVTLPTGEVVNVSVGEVLNVSV
jgi:hypothetical protein